MKEWMISWSVKHGKTTDCGSAIVEAYSEGEARTKFFEESKYKLELAHRYATVKEYVSGYAHTIS